MHVRLDEEHEAFRATVREFAERVCAPGAGERDREARFSSELVEELAAAKLLGVGVAEAYGGGGADPLAEAVLIEELARADMGASMIPFVNRAAMLPWEVAGDHAKLERWVPEIVAGRVLGAYVVTEPLAGSNVGATLTAARPDGDGWVIDGAKRFISNGSVAGLYTVLARTTEGAGHRGLSFFVVPAGTEGLRVAKVADTLGIRSSPTAELVFDGCRVPRDALVGEADRGFYYAMQTFERSRPAVAAQALGVAQAAYEAASEYLLGREQDGGVLADQQGLRWMLVDMAMRIASARLMTYEAHRRLIDGADAPMWAAMAKVWSSDMAVQVALDALQLMGGSGYVADSPAGRYLRDAKVTQIYEGANQVLRNVVARRLLGR